MSDEITPALTAEEWRTIGSDEIEPLTDRLRDAAAEATLPFHDITRHALAALALHGQPFGFTHEDVAALNRAIKALHAEASEFNFMAKHDAESDAAIEAIVRLQERIAALLPPS